MKVRTIKLDSVEKTSVGLYYTKGLEFIAILIPKIRGGGYLKTPFGGRHSNDKYKLFERANIDLVNYHQTNDIDGYLHIATEISYFDDGHEAVVKEVIDFLKDIFPQIDSWKKITGDEFFDTVELNNKNLKNEN